MYICSCHAVTDSQIKEAVESGTETFRDLCKQLKCCTNCGICAVHAKEIFDESAKTKPKKKKKKKKTK